MERGYLVRRMACMGGMESDSSQAVVGRARG